MAAVSLFKNAVRGSCSLQARRQTRDPANLASSKAMFPTRKVQSRPAAAVNVQLSPRRLTCRSMMEYMNGNQAEFQDDDEEYSPASVVEAREVQCGPDGFGIKLANGTLLQCSHNHPEGTRLPTYDSQPAIVLKLDDGSDIFLPIIVLELPSQMVLEAVRNVPLARPTVYLVIRDLIELMGYELKLVRITHRVCEAYYARIYLCKAGEEYGKLISLDLRPSDAVNLAARAKVPIQVNKALAVTDGVRVEKVCSSVRALPPLSDRPIFFPTEEDQPDESDDELEKMTGEFSILRGMMQAAREERYDEAAKLRDTLMSMRQHDEE